MKRILTINDRRPTLRMLPFRVLVPRPFRVEGSILRMRSTAYTGRAYRLADGFTLIEMMAALALAMILLYMLFQIFTTVGRAMTISNARSEIHANARAILRIMHQEISGAFLDTSRDADDDDNDGDPSSTTDPDEVGDYFIEGYGERVDHSTMVKNATFSNGSSQVTGTITNWQGLVRVGDYIRCDAATSDERWYRVISVVSDTELTLAKFYEGPDAIGADYTIGRMPFIQFLTSSAVGSSGGRPGLDEVAYWLDTNDAQNPTLRRRLGSAGSNYEPPILPSYLRFDASTKVLDLDGDGIIELDDDKLPDSPDIKLATTLGENILAFKVEYSDGNSDGGSISIDTFLNILTDDNKFWDIDEWVGKNVVAGGQRRRVVSNTSDQLIVSAVWSPILAMGERYTIEEFRDGSYAALEKRLTPAVRITLRVRDRRGRFSQGEEFVEIIAIKGKA